MKTNITIFPSKQEKRVSETVASMTTEAIQAYQDEKKIGTDEYFAINRALSKTLESSIKHMGVRLEIDRSLTYQLAKSSEVASYVHHQRKVMAAKLADYILESGLFEHESFGNYQQDIFQVHIGIFAREP